MRNALIQSITFLLGLLIGCGSLLWPLFKDRNEKLHVKSSLHTVNVLVATRDIRSGVVVDTPENLFMVRTFLSDTAPPGFVSDLENIRGKVTMRCIDKGEACTGKHFDRGSRISLPKGMRAISISFPIGSPVFQDRAEFIQPGDRVDLLVSDRDNVDLKKHLPRVVIEDVEVLLVGSTDRADHVILAVSPEDTIKIATARQGGRMTLVLRKSEQQGQRDPDLRRQSLERGRQQVRGRTDADEVQVVPGSLT